MKSGLDAMPLFLLHDLLGLFNNKPHSKSGSYCFHEFLSILKTKLAIEKPYHDLEDTVCISLNNVHP